MEQYSDNELQNRISTLINESSYIRNLAIDRAPYLDAFIKGESFPPFEIEIQPSSNCDLECVWCIGKEIQAQNRARKLPDEIDINNIDQIIEGILETRQNGLGVEIVKFSGFIGEPLYNKDVVLSAIQRLTCAGVDVGVFTNGLNMTDETWQILSNISYVHVSLDSGPRSFSWCKENKPLDSQHSSDKFHKILHNIRGLARQRKKTGWRKKMNLNVGYIVINGNHNEIYETCNLVKKAGADSIRFKCDITGEHNLCSAGVLDDAFSQIEKAQADFHNPPEFSVITVHSRDDIKNKAYTAWRSSSGCYYHLFCTTIGSDGCVYICDHNTMPGAIPLGNAINQPFSEIWNSTSRNFMISGTEHICKSSVCPPFGCKVNFFLKEIVYMREIYGADAIIEALENIRNS